MSHLLVKYKAENTEEREMFAKGSMIVARLEEKISI